MTGNVDVLIPTCERPWALAITLTSLCSQQFRGFRVIVSDQTNDADMADLAEIEAVRRVLESHGHAVAIHKHLPARGMAEQRQFLLDQATAPYTLFLDDDLLLEPFVVGQMLAAIQREGCGFVGSAVIGLSYRDDVRPHEQQVEFWNGPVLPERVEPDTPAWSRYRLHNAANVYHLQQKLGLAGGKGPAQTYRVAWVGGCVMYDVEKLRSAGGFEFWQQLPHEHCGEDVLAQLRVMARFGGCGLLPSGVYHLELPTTLDNRDHNAPRLLAID